MAYATWTEGVGELMDGKDPFAIELPNFFRGYSAQQTEVILLEGLRSAPTLKLAGGAMVIQQDRGRRGGDSRSPCLEGLKKWFEDFGTFFQFHGMGFTIYPNNASRCRRRALETL